MNAAVDTASLTQGSGDWLQARVGCATASRFRDVQAKLKSGQPAAARRAYMIRLIAERLTGQPVQTFVTAAMQWGTDNEPAARIEYAWQRELIVSEIGFVRHPSLLAGASPDGLVGDDGLIEIKCPSTETHLETRLDGMPADHRAQIQGQLWITGRQWCDFVSYDPRLPERYRLYVERIPRDDAYIRQLDADVREFLADVESAIKTLETRL